ncbi:hypothetical protein HPB50_012298 [Hyalomma asiaticum]|uniref:Uncharacterized protein n=1 Tax=Hyalomma asiaticum TaxID=266040 RepID=A0ACB7RVU5_HYAAI|nr:hypothetical protein HPB50_012298 [Hyalomma asiaticum]
MLRKLNQPTVSLTVTFGTVTRVRTLKNCLNGGKPMGFPPFPPYSGLSFLAKKVLCIPSTSASSERNFSAAGYVLQDRRTCLKPESLDNLLFLHKNM